MGTYTDGNARVMNHYPIDFITIIIINNNNNMHLIYYYNNCTYQLRVSAVERYILCSYE